ncbi:MAG TPA: HEAT repeat domain-containing protein, partial [Archangium sp.]
MTRLLAAAVCVLSLSAIAAPPKKSAAIGSSKEDEPCPAPSSVTSGADLAFIRAVQWAFEPSPPEIRTQAIEDLGLLGDARSLNLLAPLTLDANQVYARAAVR